METLYFIFLSTTLYLSLLFYLSSPHSVFFYLTLTSPARCVPSRLLLSVIVHRPPISPPNTLHFDQLMTVPTNCEMSVTKPIAFYALM